MPQTLLKSSCRFSPYFATDYSLKPEVLQRDSDIMTLLHVGLEVEMHIKVVAKKGASTTEQGNLLENFAAQFLGARGFEIKQNIQNNGIELDLLCTNKSNTAKKIYVECKAYDYKKPVSSSVILKMMGVMQVEKYDEAWIMTTAPLGKQALGLEAKISESEDAASYTFFTPEKLIQTFTDSHLVDEYVISRRKIVELIGDEKKLGESFLLITSLGNYWATLYMSSGEPSGVIYNTAVDSEIVFDEILLDKLQDLDFGYDDCDSKVVLEILLTDKEQMEFESITKLRLDTYYKDELLDLGVKINHPHSDEFTLEDIYIFPDLQTTEEKNRKKINSQNLLGSTGRSKYLIFGDELAGKTTLARLIQWQKSIRGQVTLIIDGSELQNTSPSSVEKVIENAYKHQYGATPGILETYSKLLKDTSKLNIIIDDFEKTCIKRPASRANLLTKLTEEYGDLFLFMNSDFEIEVMARIETQEQLSSFDNVRILQLGHVKRDELVTKWLQAGGNEAFSENEMLGQKSEILKRIEVAVGENFIPTNPFHLLTMLHVFEAGTKARTQGSSYADLYNYFIIQALSDAKVKPEDINFYLSYLSYLAYHLYKSEYFSVEKTTLKGIYSQFALEMDIDKDFENVHDVLVKSKIIKLDSESRYSFHLSYSRFYFIARYLAFKIDEEPIQKTINELIQNLHKTDAANIVVFLVHHSKDKTIIQGIISRARSLFEANPLQTLSKKELEKVNNLITEEMKFILKDGTPEENRKKELASRDDYEARKAEETDKDDVLDIFAQINLVFKTIDVLGQIATNYYGDLNASSKTEILDEIYTLGLRGLNGFMASFDDYVDSLTQYLEDNYNKNGMKKGAELTKAINQTIYMFMQVVTLAFLARISDSVASKNLLGTVDRVMGAHQEPAGQIIALSTHLNFPNELNKQRTAIQRLHKDLIGNYLPTDLLKITVLQHIYKFDVSLKDKQSICSTLGIDFSSLKRSGYLK